MQMASTGCHLAQTVTPTTALWLTAKAHGTYLQSWVEDNMPPAAIPAGEMGLCTLPSGEAQGLLHSPTWVKVHQPFPLLPHQCPPHKASCLQMVGHKSLTSCTQRSVPQTGCPIPLGVCGPSASVCTWRD